MIKLKQIGNGILLLAIICFANACYKQTTGCLDLFANNFSASSDQACDDCCTYPDVKLTFYSDVRPGNWVGTAVNSDSFYIISAGLYLHNFSFETPSETFDVTNQITFDLNNGDQRSYIDDFVDYVTTSTSFTVGQHKEKDSIENFSFSLGLPDDINDLDEEQIPDDNALNTDGNFLYNSNFGYASAFIRIHTDTMGGDTILYQLPISDLKLDISLDTSFLVDYGEELRLNLRVDVNSWTQGIDFEANQLDTAFIRSKFVENIPNSISLSN